jgi:hypothetical protein
LELIGLLSHRRPKRNLSFRQAVLREAVQAPKERESRPLLAQELESGPLLARETESEPPLAQSASTRRGPWECEFCGRGFYGFGSYLNHRCDREE